MAAKKRGKKVNLKEFRAWLEGVEELQPPDWAPSEDQWKLIREKINYIIEEKVEKIVERVVEVPAVVQPFQPIPNGTVPNRTIPDDGNAFAPIANSPPIAPIEMTEAAKAALGQTVDGKAKIGNLDTSDGEYNSAFS